MISFCAQGSHLLSVFFIYFFAISIFFHHFFQNKPTGGILESSEQAKFCMNVSAKTATCSFYLCIVWLIWRLIRPTSRDSLKNWTYCPHLTLYSKLSAVLPVSTLTQLDGGCCVSATETHPGFSATQDFMIMKPVQFNNVPILNYLYIFAYIFADNLMVCLLFT